MLGRRWAIGLRSAGYAQLSRLSKLIYDCFAISSLSEATNQPDHIPPREITITMRPYNIAVLECDTPLDPIVKEFGTYGDIFRKFLETGLQGYVQGGGVANVELKITTSNMVENGPFPDLKELDCILLSGSKHNAHEDVPWILRLLDFVRNVAESTQIRIVGICFGHQIIARALGGVVEKNSKGWEVSVNRVDLTPTGKRIFNLDHLDLHQMHRDTITRLPEGAENLGFSPVCEIQGLFIPKRLFSLQAHPEFNDTIMNTILDTRHEQGVFNDSMYEDAKRRVGSHDGRLIAIAVWRFLANE